MKTKAATATTAAATPSDPLNLHDHGWHAAWHSLLVGDKAHANALFEKLDAAGRDIFLGGWRAALSRMEATQLVRSVDGKCVPAVSHRTVQACEMAARRHFELKQLVADLQPRAVEAENRAACEAERRARAEAEVERLRLELARVAAQNAELETELAAASERVDAAERRAEQEAERRCVVEELERAAAAEAVRSHSSFEAAICKLHASSPAAAAAASSRLRRNFCAWAARSRAGARLRRLLALAGHDLAGALKEVGAICVGAGASQDSERLVEAVTSAHVVLAFTPAENAKATARMWSAVEMLQERLALVLAAECGERAACAEARRRVHEARLEAKMLCER